LQILVAEDEPVSRLLLERSLLAWGYDPVICCDGVEALEALRRPDAPQIAVLDWMMPNLDGLDVCRAVRAAKRPTEPYLIILTARSSQEDVIRGLQAGADDYLTKPIDRGELEMRLQVAVRVISLQQRLAERVAELESALGRVRQLHGLLPICAYCKRIRSEQNEWNQVETYITKHSNAEFSHGVCPTCLEKLLDEADA